MWEKIQWEATQEQYILNFIMVNIIFIISFFNRNKVKTSSAVWGSLLLFVLYAFWDSDYFTMRYTFYKGLDKDFRDPLYYYLSFISFGSYTIFRLIVWGTALLLFYKTIKNFKLSPNYCAFVFAIFFMLTFSYGRVSLGMALYFYGISCLLMRNNNDKSKLFKGIFFIVCSYWGHRSMIVPILLTPLIKYPLNKKIVIGLSCICGVLSGIVPILLTRFASGDVDMGENLSAVQSAAEQFSSYDWEVVRNWKFQLITMLRRYSFYILIIYILWKTLFSKDSINISPIAKRLLTLSCGITIVALAILSVPGMGADIIGYRYLYMVGIPLCLLLSYMVERRFCKLKTAIFLLIPAFLFAEGFIFGKILSF